MTEKQSETTWIIPAIAVQLPDGSTLVRPGKAVQRATAARTEALTGVPVRSLHNLADCGEITREQPTPRKFFFYPAEVEALLKKTVEIPGYWNAIRTKAFLTGKGLRTSRPR